jgi:hypothetical protein
MIFSPEIYDKESRTKGTAETFVTSILMDLMPTTNNEKKVTAPLLWDSDVTGTSSRRGAARIMEMKVRMQEIVAKTGHDMRGIKDALALLAMRPRQYQRFRLFK